MGRKKGEKKGGGGGGGKQKNQRIYTVDAFTERPFCGNPAAVCVYRKADKFDYVELFKIAAEMNLSETCYCYRLEDGRFSLRWFTPTVEVPLCGHGTLATAHVLFNEKTMYQDDLQGVDVLRFVTQRGELVVRRVPDGQLVMDFPLGAPAKVTCPVELLESIASALSLSAGGVDEVWQCNVTRKLSIVLKDERDVLNAKADSALLLALVFPADWSVKGIILTAAGTNERHDFVSRYFAPWNGILEDPVTGSAHTVLALIWAARLKKQKFVAFQASSRGGEVGVEIQENNNRVFLSGKAVTIMRGKLVQ